MAEPSEITTRAPRAELTRELVQPPTRVYMTVNDRLYIRSRNSVTALALRLAGRILTPGGDIVPFNYEHTPATDRSASIESFQVAEGFLLSAVVFPSAGAPQRGQTFVELGFLRGLDAANSIVDVLAKDYVSEAEPLAFPGSGVRSSLEGPGAVLSLTGTNPAAGAEVSETVPTDARWKLRAARLELVASAAVANRTPILNYDDGTTTFYRTRLHTAQTASQTRRYNAALQGHWESAVAGTDFITILPDVLLRAGFRFRTVTTAIDAADDWGAPQLLLEEWIED